LSELKLFDDIAEPDEDFYETDPKLIKRFQKQYGLFFELDAAATEENKKCCNHLFDALHQEWVSFGCKVLESYNISKGMAKREHMK
jgi:hypothetical protein